uniref:Si:dkey-193b15.8 n=1 Tax=Sphaeramia orbicularis TaxID=375764 RepID=A0A672ZRC7_9TELE
MSAGTIVITGGILAGVILLCIVAVLCYCRLQYYCCKKNDSEVDMVSLDQLDPGPHQDHCPGCSPFQSRHSAGAVANMRNGGERLGFHTYYDNPAASLPLCSNPQGCPSPISFYPPSDMFPPRHAPIAPRSDLCCTPTLAHALFGTHFR